MFCALTCFGLAGIDAYPVTVETDLSRGMPSFEIVGLPDTAVKEARDRVRAALLNSGFTFPQAKIVVNLAPAGMRKGGSLYDLPILLGLLAASGQIAALPQQAAFVGELSLAGEIRPVNGALSMALCAKQLGLQQLYLPAANAAEAAVVQNIAIYPLPDLKSLLHHLDGSCPLIGMQPTAAPAPCYDHLPDLAAVKGQYEAKRALEIAASGGHNLLMTGSPGTGKSMLAHCIPSILPPMQFAESVQTTRIYSAAGLLERADGLMVNRPFRAPHHSVSTAGLTGGGSMPHPGEISLAHNGVLFLDELPEFSRPTLEALRQPLEDGQVTIARAGARLTFPCRFMLVAAMNPCPCGYLGDEHHLCRCTTAQIDRYRAKISGPLLDRIDLQVELSSLPYDVISDSRPGESSATVRERVIRVRALQAKRYQALSIHCNAQLTHEQIATFCQLTPAAQQVLRRSYDRMHLSARAYDRILRVARTVADMQDQPVIDRPHLLEALQYRGKAQQQP